MTSVTTSKTPADILDSMATFNKTAKQHSKQATSLLRHTEYWVFDPSKGNFGPGKFVGYKQMTFETYALRYTSVRLDGGVTQKAIRKVVGKEFVAAPELHTSLVAWGESLLGEGAFGGADRTKWEFISLDSDNYPESIADEANPRATYLLAWNPKNWTWENQSQAAQQTAEGKAFNMRWRTGNRKNIQKGDRLFLIRLGEEPKGIIGSGTATGELETDKHYTEDRDVLYVHLEFDHLLDPNVKAPLDVASFETGPLSEVNWMTQASGIEIPPEAAELLEDLWSDHLSRAGGSEQAKAPRNPNWQIDELILALDLYLKHDGKYLEPTHEEIVELSEVLNRLPIHLGRESLIKFRNPSGVAMKLANFSRFDPRKTGVGLKAGNKLEKILWDQYADKPDVLRKMADQIRKGFASVEDVIIEDPEEIAFPEGRILYRMHRQRERKKVVIDKAKAIAKKREGKLACCVCSFDFAATYGALGDGFIEGHHTRPISEIEYEAETKVSEIALVCANCHRMLHRRRPWLDIEQLKSILKR